MSNEFVTPEDLAIALKFYAKTSEVDARLRDTDSAIRIFIDRTLQIAHQELSTKVELKLDSTKTEVQKLLNSQIGSNRDTANRELEAKVLSLKEGVSQYLLSQALKYVEQKSSELRCEYLNAQNKAQETIEQALKKQHEENSTHLTHVLAAAQNSAKKVSEEVSRAYIDSIQTRTVAAVESAMSQIVQLQTKKFEEFKDVLDFELSQKVIEKAQIERKIAEIQIELQAKTQSVIEFQLEQARAMMEQNTRNEVRDRIQESIIDLLSK
jgi:hypothetical protein